MIKSCEYRFRNGKRCEEAALSDSKHCILHIVLPEDEQSKEFKRLNQLKEAKVKEKVNKGDFNFEGAKLFEVNFSGIAIDRSRVGYRGACFIGDVGFIDAVIRSDAWFNGAKIGVTVGFGGAVIGGYAWFNEAEIKGDVSFNEKARIVKSAFFDGAKICGNFSFSDANVGGDLLFRKAEIEGYISLYPTEIGGSLDFRGARFKRPKAQEWACRKARIKLEEVGNRGEADDYFYREMEAKRKQKHRIIRFLELPVQYIFGYGVYPWRVITTWLLVVFSLAVVYWIGNGVEAATSLWEYLYFSIVTAATPGYGGYHPKPGIFQGLASFEAIFGTFMWAAFIATFARKYMR